jgi:cell division septal protein FtsQ
MFKKSPLKSKKLVRRKRRMRIFKVSLVIILLLAVITGLSFLSKMRALAITTISVQGNSAVDTDDLKTIAQGYLGGNYLMLFSRTNAFLYPKQKILDEVASKFKRIETVKINVSGMHTLVMTITERKPLYVWCNGTPTDTSQKKCFFLDATGYIFSEAPVFSGNAFFAFYGQLSSEEPIGSHYLETGLFNGIDKLIVWLGDQGIQSHALLAKGEGVYELYLNKAGKIIFKDMKKSGDFSQLQSTVQTIMQNTDILSKNSSTTIDYVDLRFGNKVYYKFVGDNSVQLDN